MPPCRSAHRCNQIACETCAWRHSRHVTCRILEGWAEPFFAVALAISDPSPAGFRAFRTEIRNRIDYLRRSCPLWRAFGWVLYSGKDGVLRGVATLGVLGPAEVISALQRWNVTLRM